MGVCAADLPGNWGWKLTRPSGRGLGEDAVDYAAALRDGLTVPVEESPGVLLRRRKQPWFRAAPYATGSAYLPFVTEFPFGLWVVTLVPAGEEARAGRNWHQKIWRRVPAWWALGPQGRAAAALISRLERATWQEILALRHCYDKAWPPDVEDPAWYEARDLAASSGRATLRSALIAHADNALARAARSHGKTIEDFSDEAKSAAFAACALAVEDISPGLARRLLGPLRLALGDVHTWPVPSWADAL